MAGWLVPADDAEARGAVTLDGIYSGQSAKIARMLQVAYRRGVRRGASAAWSAGQKVSLR